MRVVDSALRGVRAAAEVERIERGLTREQRRQMAAVVDHRILEAVRFGATPEQVADALGVGLSRAQERIRRSARAEADQAPPAPPTVWREVPMCGRGAPPPWPVYVRCRLDTGHAEDHYWTLR